MGSAIGLGVDMSRRRPFNTTRSLVRPGRRQRIRIPQPIKRPLILRSRDALKGEVISPSDDQLTIHRRGPRRSLVGLDPLEARAVPHSQVRGTLPERIIWKYLVDIVRWQPEVHFSFQSSLDGGRSELGGLVADFIIFHLRLILNPLGPTHTDFLRKAKDEENRQTYAEMGYVQEEIWEKDVYNEQYFEGWIRRVLGFTTGATGGAGNYVSRTAGDPDEWQAVLDEAQAMHAVAARL